jgi:hypothetical protein
MLPKCCLDLMTWTESKQGEFSPILPLQLKRVTGWSGVASPSAAAFLFRRKSSWRGPGRCRCHGSHLCHGGQGNSILHVRGSIDAGDSRVIQWARTWSRPEELTISFGDRDVIDAGFSSAHQPVFIELPKFVTVTSKPAR